MLFTILRNWKTTSAGIGTIAAAIADMTANKSISMVNITAIITGIGLILGKDFNVTGA